MNKNGRHLLQLFLSVYLFNCYLSFAQGLSRQMFERGLLFLANSG